MYSRKLLALSIVVTMPLLLVACSEGDDSQMAAPPSNDAIGTASDSIVINSSTARTIAIESLELADSLTFYFAILPNAIFAAASEAALCSSDGSVMVTGDGTLRTYVFDSCQLFPEIDVRLNGQMSLDGTVNNGFIGEQAFTGFSAVSGLRIVSIDGSATIENIAGNVNASNAEVVISDSQSDTTMTMSAFSIDNPSSAAQNVSMNLTVAMNRFGLENTTVSSAGLGGEAVYCPQSGSLEVNAGDDGSLLINGGDGENLTFMIGDTTDTLACSEIASIFDPNSDGLFEPPAAPGS